MATSTVRDGVFVWSNLLTASPVFQALTWLFQITPLFFFAVRPRCRQSDGDGRTRACSASR
ncbi:MAG TPA: hypothetical protein VEX40_10175 [Mycobacterium sp.]|nr:hypothetical protein [Mycobacterium sp.]